MVGILFGALCGVCELILLRLLVDRVSVGEMPFWILPLKLLIIPLFLVPCALIARDQLHLAGIAAAVVLIGGAVAIFCFRAYQKKEQKLASDAEAGGKSK